MQLTVIYLISFGAFLGGVTLWKLFQRINARRRAALSFFLRRRMMYTMVWSRCNGSSDFSVLAFLLVVGFAIANIVICTFRLRDRGDLAKRCGALFIINVIPLYLGGRTSLLVDRLFQVSLSEYGLAHRWVGRICVIQGLIHALINVSTSKPSVTNILLISSLASLGGLSIVYIRRYMYEIFLKTHLIFATGFIGLLLNHVHISQLRALICVCLAISLWVVQHLAWFGRLVYRNSWFKSTADATFNAFPCNQGSLQTMEATITLSKTRNFRAGQYIYLTMPSLCRHRGDFIQSHPYIVAWADGNEITLLIQRMNGFSDRIFSSRLRRSSLLIDGPYGKARSLAGYDKVLFMASGIGIAAHLLPIKQLLEAHQLQTARVRRLTLVWFLESADQEAWASHFLCQLFHMDQRHIFTLALYTPSVQSESLNYDSHASSDRWSRRNEPLNLGWYIRNEWAAEAGNMALSVCGYPFFEKAVRKAVRNGTNDISLFPTSFFPVETHESQVSRARLEGIGDSKEPNVVKS